MPNLLYSVFSVNSTYPPDFQLKGYNNSLLDSREFSDRKILLLQIFKQEFMSDNIPQLELKYKFWIETSDQVSILGEGKWVLLKAIRDTGSLKAAVDQMGYAYRQTWENLKKIEEKLGFSLIEKSRGGASGGQTVLTAKGAELVSFFERLYSEIDPVIQRHLAGMQDELNDILKL